MISTTRVFRPLALVSGLALCGATAFCSSPARAQQDAPAAAWTFDEGSGTTAADASGHGNTGTLQGSAAWASPGKVGPAALNLTGGGSVDVPAPVVDTRGSFTVSAWVNLHQVSGYQTFVSIDGAQSSGFFLQLRGGSSFALTLPATDQATQAGTIVNSSTRIRPDTWYHLVGVHDAATQTASLYVDGLLQQSLPDKTTWQAMGHTEIGRGLYAGSPTDFVNGEIDDVKIYSGVHLDPQEAAQMAQATAQILHPSLVIHADQSGPQINPIMYGLMIEDISHSIDGGLYAELIRNRVFKNNPTTPVHWSLVPGDGAGAMALDTTQPVPNTALTTSLRLDVTSAGTGRGVGIANEGYWGIPVTPDTRYRASFYAKSGSGFHGPLTAAIESNDGAKVFASATVPGVTPQWKKYTVTLTTPKGVTPSETNQFVIAAHGVGTVWFTQVSLFPPTYDNRPNGARIDLMKMLAAMHPGFLRLPGGNYLEGNTVAERFEWKNTVGPLSQRPGHPDPWGYRSDDGFGLLEYLEWCQDLHMQPVLAVFAGYALKHEYVPPGPALQPYVQDALDEIQYVTGGTDTPWGAVRAKDGHPAPFPLHYVEIGNEDWFDRSGSYEGRFAQFYDAIKAQYPKLLLIATTHVKSRVPDLVDDHYYRSPADFESMATQYDNYKRTDPKVFVGEYASQEGQPTPDLNSALGDAAFMTGLERNADVVRIASYAPLLVNVNRGARQWGTNLIGFDALHAYGSPSYYVQKMFSLYHGDTVVPVTVAGGSGLFAEVSRVTKTGLLYVKLVNTSAAARKAAITLSGVKSVAPTGTAIVLKSASPTDTNTLDDPNHVVPVTSPVTGLGPSFSYTLPPYSFTVLELKTK